MENKEQKAEYEKKRALEKSMANGFFSYFRLQRFIPYTESKRIAHRYMAIDIELQFYHY